MKEYMNEYLDKIKQDEESGKRKPAELLNDFEKHLSFFQHERLIHLIVTALFAIMTLLSIGADVFKFSPGVFALSLIFFIMTIAYIRHYYFLENTVQKMYKIYDRLYGKANLSCKEEDEK